MGGFGEGVSVLLDTYTRCLELLKTPVSKKHRDRDRADMASRSDARSQLRASMRSDRAQIHQAYASKLSVSGSRLDKGDRPSRSAIRQILDRVRTAMRPLLAKPRPAASDYGSLVSLSSTWRSDALRTMDQLSQRLGQAGSPRGRRASTPVATEGVEHEARRVPPTQHKAPKRSSFATTSSDSTQLGEVPLRTARRHRHSSASSGGSYGVPTIYPLHTYGPAPKKRGGFWQRLFSNGK